MFQLYVIISLLAHKEEIKFTVKCWSEIWVFYVSVYEGWNFNSGNYLFTTDTKYEGWNFNSGNYLFTTDTK